MTDTKPETSKRRGSGRKQRRVIGKILGKPKVFMESKIFCSAEWHFRDNPYSGAIYSLAQRIAKRDPERGGKRYFYLSLQETADYFGWGKPTVAKALKYAQSTGLFRLTRQGDYRTSNEYELVDHNELADKTACREAFVYEEADASGSTLEPQRLNLRTTEVKP